MKTKSNQIFQFTLLAVLIVSSFMPFQIQRTEAGSPPSSDSSVSFQIIHVFEDGLDLFITAPSYQITETEIDGQIFDTINVPGANKSITAGNPELPIASTLVGVPPQAEISLEITSDSSSTITGFYQISMAPYPARVEKEESAGNQWDYQIANALSEELALQNNRDFSAVRIADEAWIRDQRVVRIEYSPFEYNPISGKLVWHSNLNIRLKYEYPAGKPLTDLTNVNPLDSQPQFEALLKDALLNYDQAREWRALPVSTSAQVTPPNVGSRYRIAVNEDGIYKLTYEELAAANPDIANNINSQHLQMTSQGEDIAIQVVDGNGIFGPGDYIIFYGQRFYGDRLADLYAAENEHYETFVSQQTDGSYTLWKPEFNDIMLEKYTHENVYWLYVGADNGLRMQTVNGDPSGNSNDPVPYYRKTIREEDSTIWGTTFFVGEDTWFWKRIQATGASVPFTTTISAPANSGPNAIIRADFVSGYEDAGPGFDHHTKVYFNSVLYENFYWSGISRYSFEHSLTPASIQNGINTLGIEALSDAEVSNPSYYFDWFEVEYNRLFEAENNAITFSHNDSGTHKFQINNFTNTSNLKVLDISNPQLPIRVLNPTVTPNQVTISLTHTDPLSVTMAAGTKNIPAEKISFFTPPEWDAMTTGFDYVFITHSDFLTATQNLANYRENSGLSTVVFSFDLLVNEFNFGIYNPIAIKNFLAYAFDSWDFPPTYALLVGDGHWNFHKYDLEKFGDTPIYLPPNLGWVDPWQGEVDSANLLATIVGSDAYPDVIIARLPVNNSTEIENYLDKLTNYEAPHTPEAWEQNHLFIADNADIAGNFPDFADDIINQYIAPTPFAEEIRLYQDNFGCTSSSSAACAAMRYAITNTINITGSLMVNFIGHASIARWSHERIFTPAQFPQLNNSGQLPVILSMTCLDGYWIGPPDWAGSSMIEEIVRQSDTGAIASFSPTGLGVSTGHDILHRGFYDSLMRDGIWELGAASQKAKLWLFEVGIHPDLLHTYTIFGDPALQIRNPFDFSAVPEESIKFTEIPGDILTHQIVVQNTGTVPDRFLIEINNTPNWDLTLPYTITNQIAPGNQVTIPIQVQTPNPGSGSDEAIVIIRSEGDKSLIFESRLISQIVTEVFDTFLPFISK